MPQITMPVKKAESLEMEDTSRRLYRQFFESVKHEERLPFTKEEKELAAFVFPIVDEMLQTQLMENTWLPKTDPSKDPEFEERKQRIRDNLKVIIFTFSDANVQYNEFMKGFTLCEEKRVANIAKLRELAAAINKDRHNSNISQVTGSSVGAVGCAVIGSALIFPPAAIVLAIVGGVVAGVGSAVTIGTTVTEAFLLRQNIKEAKTVLETDMEESKIVEKWFTHSIEFRAAVQVVLSVNMMESLARKFRDLKRDSSSFEAEFRRRIREFMADLFACMEVTATKVPLLSITITTLCVLFVLRKRRHFIYDAINITTRLFHSFTNGLELGVEVTRIIAQIFMRGGVAAVGKLPANVARIVFNGVFAGLGMALDVINIIYTSVDMSRGSKSQRAGKIASAANDLEKELNLWRNIYSGLRIPTGPNIGDIGRRYRTL